MKIKTMNIRTDLTQKTRLFIYYGFIILTAFSIVSCNQKKEFATAKIDDVYIAGGITIKGKQYPAYWKNGKMGKLSEQSGSVIAIAVNNAAVYAVGYLEAKPNQIIVWKNKIPIEIKASGAQRVNAIGITLSGTDVYVAGSQNNGNGENSIAKYWKIDSRNQITDTSLPKPNPGNNAYGNGIAVLHNHIYVIGTIRNGSESIAALWRDGVYIPLTDGTSNAYAEGIAVSGNDIYIGGSEDDTVKYWKYDGKSVNSYSLGVIDESGVGINCIAVNANKVYMAGSDSETFKKATYWDNGTIVQLENSASITGESSAQIALAGNNVYVTGYHKNNNTSYLWKNGNLMPPFDGKNEAIDALALYVVEK